MPRFDKTGPNGEGSMTGRKSGLCTGNKINESDFPSGFGRGSGRYGAGRGGFGFRFRRGQGNTAFMNENNPNQEKLLQDEINEMKNQLSQMEDQLAKIKNKK